VSDIFYESPSRGLKVLIADDDPAVLKLLADRCAKMGFEVETAANGIQTLVMARRGHPDILIVDVNLPQIDGLSICARLLEPGAPNIEVVVITGGRSSETVERCESFGAFYGRKGPQFWESITAALAEIRPDMADRIMTTAIGPAGVRGRPCVLIVDDDPDIHTFLQSRLDKCGVDTLYAADATQAFRIACREAPNVILSDFFMPDGDAQYLLSRLRTTAATSEIPVMVMSGRELDDRTTQNLRREICGHPGVAQIFRKSFDTHALFSALQNFCGFENNRVSPAWI